MKNKASYCFYSLVCYIKDILFKGQSKDIADSLAQPVAICQEVGLNLHGKSTQRAACVVLIMIRESLKSMQSQVSSNVKSN